MDLSETGLLKRLKVIILNFYRNGKIKTMEDCNVLLHDHELYQGNIISDYLNLTYFQVEYTLTLDHLGVTLTGNDVLFDSKSNEVDIEAESLIDHGKTFAKFGQLKPILTGHDGANGRHARKHVDMEHELERITIYF